MCFLADPVGDHSVKWRNTSIIRGAMLKIIAERFPDNLVFKVICKIGNQAAVQEKKRK